jgi:hypothetical protein
MAMINRPKMVQKTAIPVNTSNSPAFFDNSPTSPATLFPHPVAAK